MQNSYLLILRIALRFGRVRTSRNATEICMDSVTSKTQRPIPAARGAASAGKTNARRPAVRSSRADRLGAVGWWLTALAGLVVAAIGSSLAEGDSEQAPAG